MKRIAVFSLLVLFVAAIVPAEGTHPSLKGPPNYEQWRRWSQVERETFVSGMMDMAEKIHRFARATEQPNIAFIETFDLSHMTVREVVNAITMYYGAADIGDGREHTIALIFFSLGVVREVMREQQRGRP